MDSLLFIDNYFTTRPTGGMKEEFTRRLSEDPSFSENVAFYLSSKEVIHELLVSGKKQRFKELYKQYRTTQQPEKQQGIVRRLWPYAAAAAVIAVVVISWSLFFSSASPARLADKYTEEHFKTLSVTMSSREDSLQTGIRLYNENKLPESLAWFESIMQRDISSPEAKKYAGIVSLQSGDYDKALKYFEELENYPGLQVNPGKLYHALTLMKRGLPGDKEAAKQLLLEVTEKNLEGNKQARVWLRKL